ncbi:MAG: hypothetical protein L3J45_00760 [Flavobacteriaceae bacterium]|nr:hypothetical protein [Flavobacteriaceae bacterium]
MSFFKDSTRLVSVTNKMMAPPQKLNPKKIIKKTIATPLKYSLKAPKAKYLDIKPVVVTVNTVGKPQQRPFLFKGKKIKYHKIFKAPNLLFRDNSKYNIKYLNREHGAFSDVITDIAQDSMGFMWLGSGDLGLAKYDGRTFSIVDTQSGLSSNGIENLFLDSKNRLWVTAKDGLYYIKNDSLFTLSKFKETLFNKVSEDTEHNIWIATLNKGAFKYKKDSVLIFNKGTGLSDNGVLQVFQESNGVYWFGMHNGKGFSRYDGKYFYHYFLEKQKLGADVHSFIAYDKKIWIGTFEAGLIYYDGSGFYRYNFGYNTYSFAKNKEGLWFNVYGVGLGNYKAGVFNFITKKEGLPGRSTYRIFNDRDDNIWLADLFSGFSRLDKNIFYNETFKGEVPIKRVENIVTDPAGTEWFFQNGGRIVSKKGTQFFAYSNETSNKITAIHHAFDGYFTAPGKAWLTTYTMGIALFTEKNFTFYQFKKGYNFLDIECDLKKRLWFSSEKNGVVYRYKEAFYSINKDNGLSEDNITALLCDAKGRTWLALEHSGVAIINNDTITTLTQGRGLLSNDVTALFEDSQKHFWIGTQSSGLQLIEGENTYTFDESKGLLSNQIVSVLQENKNIFWVTTVLGLSRLTFDETRNVTIKNFGVAYGLNLVGLSRASKVYKTHKIVWGAKQGLLVYQKPYEGLNPQKPVLILNSLFLDGEKVIKNPNTPIKLKHHQKLKPNFSALNWGYESTLKYHYKISKKKSHNKWLPLSSENKAVFSNLNLDVTEIQIKATSLTGESNIVRIAVKVQPYFYQNIYYHILFWIIIIGITVFYFQYKKKLALNKKRDLEKIISQKTAVILSEKEALGKSHKKILIQNKEKDALIQEVHHRVKNNLQLISSLVSMQIASLKESKSKKILLETYNRIASMALVHEVLYTKDNVSYISLRKYLSDLINNLNEMVNLEHIDIQFNTALDDIKLNVSDCIALGMIANESVSNAIKYAFKNNKNPKIDITLKSDKERQEISFIIKDNGVGIASKYLKNTDRSLGVRLITIFAKQLNASIEINNKKGTEILIQFKCRNNEDCNR